MLALVGCGTEVSVPPPTADAATIERQQQSFVEALKPERPGRPLIVVVARNDGTETTDFLLSHAVLERADVADVQAVAQRRGRVTLYPALQVEVAQDLADFDRSHPSGADYVIVPAMDDADEPAINQWLRQQADKGARIVGVCAGALIVGRAGLLDGRRFVTHWYYRDRVLERHAGATYVPNQRYVVDGRIATTTGISASIPSMLALVEAIGGRAKANEVAAEIGVGSWSPAHDSSRFGLDARARWNFVLNALAFWRDEDWRVDVREGMDDIALALAADAWSRTRHIEVEAASPSGPVTLRSGIKLVAGPAPEDTPRLPLAEGLRPVKQLDYTLCEIGERFGPSRRRWVANELEYPLAGEACAPDTASDHVPAAG